MTEKFYNNKKVESELLDSSDDYDGNDFFQQKFNLDDHDLTNNNERKTEILWSRENKYFPTENDFFIAEDDCFSDLTGRSTSSCSWHNDEFDMKSSTKVSLSLEAVDDALYEKQPSPFISEAVYKECCSWSDRFPYFRLKGEQITRPPDDSPAALYRSLQSDVTHSRSSPLSLQVEGKKIALHVVTDKTGKKTIQPSVPDSDQQVAFFEEEIVAGDVEYKERFISQCMNSEVELSEQPANTETAATLNYLQDKVIEKLAQHVWPKVLEALQRSPSAQNTNEIDARFQLPPIASAAQTEHGRKYLQRPRTEGTGLSVLDFPKLGSILSVSPKVLQDRKDCRSGKIRSSRPSSEIHLSSRNSLLSQSVTQKPSSIPPSKQVQFSSSKRGMKNDDNKAPPLHLPALEEDITDPIDYLKGFSLKTEPKTTVISHLPKNSECFLPPIDTDDRSLSSDMKLTRNLFTFFESDLKCKDEMIHNRLKTPASRPNTCASKRGMKQTDNLGYRLINEISSSGNNSNQVESRKCASEKQVTLFPIVTSLLPSRERNSKKSSLHSLSGRKR